MPSRRFLCSGLSTAPQFQPWRAKPNRQTAKAAADPRCPLIGNANRHLSTKPVFQACKQVSMGVFSAIPTVHDIRHLRTLQIDRRAVAAMIQLPGVALAQQFAAMMA